MLIGGTEVGAQTLVRFYVLHVAVLPAALIGLLLVHLWRWRKDSMLDVGTEAPVMMTGCCRDGACR